MMTGVRILGRLWAILTGRARARPMGQLVVDRDTETAWAHQMRTACDECGAAVRWVDVDEATRHGLDVADAARALGVSSIEGLDVWVCTRCDNAGVMGPTEMG